jgi:hypothetical protein
MRHSVYDMLRGRTMRAWRCAGFHWTRDSTITETNVYQLLQRLTTSEIFLRQVPALGLSFVIAELFYKFHSFTLECLAFLATWFVLDAAGQLVVARLGGRGARAGDGN